MDLSTFTGWQFLFLSTFIAGITLVIRKVIEYYILDNPNLPGDKKSKIWTSLVLPLTPLVIGCLFGWLVSGYPYPDGITHVSARIALGMVAGMLSGSVYRVIKELLVKQAPEALQSDESDK